MLGRKNSRAVRKINSSTPIKTVQASPFQWSGYTWSIRPSYDDHGPGSNAWSDQNVEKDQYDNLYLSLVNRTGKWTCVEIAGPSLGYGRYDFYLESDPTAWDRRPVLGIFTYDDTAADTQYREIDIEITKWSNPANTSTVWYTMNPIQETNQSCHQVSAFSPYKCSFVWQSGQVYFETTDKDGNLLGNHLTNQTVFAPGKETVRINLWLYRTSEETAAGILPAPADGQPLTVRISKFVFTPNDTYQLLPAGRFVADFTDGQQDGFDLRNGTAVQDGRLVLPCVDASEGKSQATAATGAVIDLQESSVAIHVTSVPNKGNRTTEGIWQIRYNASNYIGMLYADGNLICRKRENGVFTDESVTYDSAQHKYWRIAEKNNEIIFSTSQDFTNWATLCTMPHNFGTYIRLMRLRFAAGFHGVETEPGAFVIDSINYQ